MFRRLAFIALAAVALACTNGDADPGETAAEQQDVVVYDDDRMTFDYPAGFEVAHQGEGGEFSVRIVSPDGGDPAEATIFALWPLPTNNDLERTVNFYGPDTGSSTVSDFEERDIEVVGATEALEHRFTATDAVPGEVRPMKFVSVYAMAEAGRTFNLVVGVDEASDYDVETLADTVLGSLQLKDFEPGDEDRGATGSGAVAPVILDDRVHLDVPEGWEVDEERSTERRLWIASPDEAVMLFVERMPQSVADEDLGELFDDLTADATGEISVQDVTIPGAVEARQFRRQADGGLWQQVAIARDGDGRVYSVVLAADVADVPSPDVIEQILGSFALAPTGDTT